LLASLSKFVIVDITNPRSAPLELQATVPDYMVPFAPILQHGEQPFSMFVDLQNKYDWVLQPVVGYSSVDRLIEVLEDICRPGLRNQVWRQHIAPFAFCHDDDAAGRRVYHRQETTNGTETSNACRIRAIRRVLRL